jgi:hypothetical protein
MLPRTRSAAWPAILAAALAVAHVSLEPDVLLWLAAALAALLACVRSPWPLAALAAAVVLLAGSGDIHARRAGYGSAAWTDAWLAQRAIAVQNRQTAVGEPLLSLAAAVAGRPEALAALDGDAAARSRLFLELEREAAPWRALHPEPVAVAVHTPQLGPVAWSGRIPSPAS